jgi:rhodanese-related sulfurtransferase
MEHSKEFLAIVDDARTRVKEITIEEVKEKTTSGKPFHFVDVREESEWNAGHAENAIHISKGVLERDVLAKLPDKTDEIILYCGGGFRSLLAADNLQKMGYTQVLSMTGGWREWIEQGGGL